MSAKLEAALPSLYFLNPIIFYGRGLPLLSGSGMRYTPFGNESARIESLGQESCQRAYRCATRFGGSPKKPPAFMWRSRHKQTVGTRRVPQLSELVRLEV